MSAPARAARSAASKSRGAGRAAHRRSSSARGAARLRSATSKVLSATIRSRMLDITPPLEIAAQPSPLKRLHRNTGELVEDEVADGAGRRQIADDAAAGDQGLEQRIPGTASGRGRSGGNDGGFQGAATPQDVLGPRPLATLGHRLALDLHDVQREVEDGRVGDRRADAVRIHHGVEVQDLVLVDAAGGDDLDVVEPPEIQLPADFLARA